MKQEALDGVKKINADYDALPCVMGKRAQEAACRFINENHAGFKDLKSLLDAYESMREENGKLLAFAVREVRGCDLSSHFDEMERITGQRHRGTKQTLGGKDGR